MRSVWGVLGGTPGCLSGFGFDPEDCFVVIGTAILQCFSSWVVLLGLSWVLGIVFFFMRGLVGSFGGPGGSRGIPEGRSGCPQGGPGRLLGFGFNRLIGFGFTYFLISRAFL